MKVCNQNPDDDLNVVVVRDGKKEYQNEDCMTVLTTVIKSNGEIGCSYFGAQSEDLLKVINKVQHKYLLKLKKDFVLTKKQKKMCDEKYQNKDIKVKKSKSAKKSTQKNIKSKQAKLDKESE